MISINRSDGYVLKLEDLMDITAISGLYSIDREIITVKQAFGNGDIKVGSRIPSRIIRIEADVINYEIKKTIRKILREFFRVGYTFELHILDIEVPLFIPFELDLLDIPHRYEGENVPISMDLYCENPFFRSVYEFGKDIAFVTPTGGFPMYLDEKNVLGVFNFANEVFLENEGDDATYIKAIVTASDTVANFKLFTDDENFVQFREPLLKGESAVIDFELGTIYIDEINRSNIITRDSSYFQITQGGTQVKFSATQGEDTVSVYLFYNQLYNGVDEI